MEKNGNIFLVTGNDELVIQERSRKLFESLTGKDANPFSSDVYAEGEEGPSPELIRDLIRSLCTPSMLGGKKTVWLKHSTCLGSEGGGEFGAALRELVEFLKQGLPEDVVLLMDGTGVDKRKGLYKVCFAQGEVLWFDRLDMKQRDWQNAACRQMEERIAEKNLHFSPEAFQYFQTVLGTDVARLDAELEKIICSRGTTEGVVSLEEVALVCVGKGEEATWALGEKLGTRSPEQVLRCVDVLLEQKGEEYARSLMLSAAGFFRSALRIHLCMALRRLSTPRDLNFFVTRLSAEEKQQLQAEGMDFVGYHPFRVQKMAEQAIRYSPAEAISAIHLFCQMLWRVTAGGLSSRVALETALLQILPPAPDVRRGGFR